MAESNLEDGQFGEKGDCIRHWTERNTELKDKMVLQKPQKREKRPQQKSNTAGRLNVDGRWDRGGRRYSSGLDNRVEITGNIEKN